MNRVPIQIIYSPIRLKLTVFISDHKFERINRKMKNEAKTNWRILFLLTPFLLFKSPKNNNINPKLTDWIAGGHIINDDTKISEITNNGSSKNFLKIICIEYYI